MTHVNEKFVVHYRPLKWISVLLAIMTPMLMYYSVFVESALKILSNGQIIAQITMWLCIEIVAMLGFIQSLKTLDVNVESLVLHTGFSKTDQQYSIKNITKVDCDATNYLGYPYGVRKITMIFSDQTKFRVSFVAIGYRQLLIYLSEHGLIPNVQNLDAKRRKGLARDWVARIGFLLILLLCWYVYNVKR